MASPSTAYALRSRRSLSSLAGSSRAPTPSSTRNIDDVDGVVPGPRGQKRKRSQLSPSQSDTDTDTEEDAVPGVPTGTVASVGSVGSLVGNLDNLLLNQNNIPPLDSSRGSERRVCISDIEKNVEAILNPSFAALEHILLFKSPSPSAFEYCVTRLLALCPLEVSGPASNLALHASKLISLGYKCNEPRLVATGVYHFLRSGKTLPVPRPHVNKFNDAWDDLLKRWSRPPNFKASVCFADSEDNSCINGTETGSRRFVARVQRRVKSLKKQFADDPIAGLAEAAGLFNVTPSVKRQKVLDRVVVCSSCKVGTKLYWSAQKRQLRDSWTEKVESVMS